MDYRISLELTEEQSLALGHVLQREMFGSADLLADSYYKRLSEIDDLLNEATLTAEVETDKA